MLAARLVDGPAASRARLLTGVVAAEAVAFAWLAAELLFGIAGRGVVRP